MKRITCMAMLAVVLTVVTSAYAVSKKSPAQGHGVDFISELKRLAPHNHQIDRLAKNDSHLVSQTGSDAKLRPDFVNAQAVVEQLIAAMLSDGRIKRSVGIIHTPAPPTPLCTEGEISQGLVHPSIAHDKKRVETVTERPSILRDYLKSGGRLFAAFPKDGRSKRTSEQLAIYDRLRAEYSRDLKQAFLNTDQLESDMIGATYLFQMNDGSWMAFSIKSRQANDPKDKSEWAMWLGKMSDPQIAERVKEIDRFLSPLTRSRMIPRQVYLLTKK